MPSKESAAVKTSFCLNTEQTAQSGGSRRFPDAQQTAGLTKTVYVELSERRVPLPGLCHVVEWKTNELGEEALVTLRP